MLDEPTTGLHADDVRKLLAVLDRLLARGDSVVVIEHHLDVIAAADHVLEMGPEAGSGGGQIVVAGTPEAAAACAASHTGRFLRDRLAVRAAAAIAPPRVAKTNSASKGPTKSKGKGKSRGAGKAPAKDEGEA